MQFQSSATQTKAHVWMDLHHLDNIAFDVQMSANAEIILAPYMFQADVQHYYSVVIGSSSNTKTVIM